MKLEKRSTGEPEEPVQPDKPTPNKKQPVVVYIMVLFIVAFLLMALSFFMHQRSNTEALGQLQHDMNALQAVQRPGSGKSFSRRRSPTQRTRSKPCRKRTPTLSRLWPRASGPLKRCWGCIPCSRIT